MRSTVECLDKTCEIVAETYRAASVGKIGQRPVQSSPSVFASRSIRAVQSGRLE